MFKTRMPGAPVIQALIKGDRDGFYAAETKSRRAAAAPPFARLAAIIVSSEDNKEAMETARLIGQTAPKVEGFSVFGPCPCSAGDAARPASAQITGACAPDHRIAGHYARLAGESRMAARGPCRCRCRSL